MTLALSTPLGQVKDWLRARVEGGGEKCPCCGQLAKVYQRSINSGAARGLIRFYRLYGTDWGHQPSVPEMSRLGGEWARMTHWGLLEEETERRPDGGRAGYWRVTEKGREFIGGEMNIPKYVRLYDGRFLGFTGEQVTIKDSLGDKFDLQELMAR